MPRTVTDTAGAEPLGPCPLCGRAMVAGYSTNLHHLVPRRFKGRDAVLMHRICHDKIHAVLSDRELRDEWSSVERLATHPEIAAFVRWVQRKPAEFVDGHHGTARGGGGRRP